MPVNRLEALHDAIASLRGFSNPESECYQLRNPLMLPSFSRPGKNEVDAKGRRVFASALAGIRAGLFDIQTKISGESRANIKLTDNLSNLLRVYGLVEKLSHQQVVKYLKRALKDESLTTETPLSYFREQV